MIVAFIIIIIITIIITLMCINIIFIYNSPRDHALQNQRGDKLCDRHGTGTHVVTLSHLYASALGEATSK